MSVHKTYAEINEKIKSGKAVVVTAEEIIDLVKEKGEETVAKEVDVVTTATFGAMCSTGAFLNFGHADPPIRMSKVWLNDVPAYAGLAAVDAFIGATESSEIEGNQYGGAHVIEDLISGKSVKLRAIAQPTDCYPRREITTYITKNDINQAFLFNPRNAYQNYDAATNTSGRTLYTYMGTLLPHLGNVTYSSAGQLSPLLNDPFYRTIGIGTRIFLGGAQGFVSWEGTQHSPSNPRGENGVPQGPAGTLSLIGNLKEMDARFIRAASFESYGVTMFVGLGIPIPILDIEMLRSVCITDADIYTNIIDYSIPKRSKPVIKQVNYQQLRSGSITIDNKRIPTAPLSSLAKAREVALELKQWIQAGNFLISEPVQCLPQSHENHVLNSKLKEEKEPCSL